MLFLLLAKKFWSSWKKFDGSGEQKSIRARDHYEENSSFGAVNVFWLTLYIWRNLRQCCWSCIQGVEANFPVRKILTFVLSVWVSSIKIDVCCSSCYHFETMSQRSTFSLGRKVSAGLSTLQFRCPDEIFDDTLSLEKITKFHQFGIVGEKFWLPMEKVWQRCRNHILRVHEIGLTRGVFLF